MKGKALIFPLLLAIGLAGCTSAGDSDDTTVTSQSTSATSHSTTASTLPDTAPTTKATFASETQKLADDPNYQVDKIEIMDKDGFDWIMVRLDDSVHELSEQEQLAHCQELHPQILAAYEDYYADETESIHRPIASYFTEGFDEIARTDPNASDYETITLMNATK
ncbi:hypothetical protein [Enterococcus asini]|uniref:hypothetical protein n=1 Tax=Enterococcus asini TaxID=57732 RepID=UPI0028914177|nr:hypothetical protein [Enterococcus asini]MDT2744562.1 hypothetical protein [Enterococcus asini]